MSHVCQGTANNQAGSLDNKNERERKEQSGNKEGEKKQNEKRRGKKEDGQGGERERTEDSKHIDGRHTHESDNDSDDEEKGPKGRLRPHVPGLLGLAPPLGGSRQETGVCCPS